MVSVAAILIAAAAKPIKTSHPKRTTAALDDLTQWFKNAPRTLYSNKTGFYQSALTGSELLVVPAGAAFLSWLRTFAQGSGADALTFGAEISGASESGAGTPTPLRKSFPTLGTNRLTLGTDTPTPGADALTLLHLTVVLFTLISDD